jgi:hypothetical protein
MRKHTLPSDNLLNPTLKKEVSELRGGILEQAETIKLNERFAVHPHENKPSMIIKDLTTGNSTEVPLFAYREVRKALNNLFE